MLAHWTNLLGCLASKVSSSGRGPVAGQLRKQVPTSGLSPARLALSTSSTFRSPHRTRRSRDGDTQGRKLRQLAFDRRKCWSRLGGSACAAVDRGHITCPKVAVSGKVRATAPPLGVVTFFAWVRWWRSQHPGRARAVRCETSWRISPHLSNLPGESTLVE